MCTKVSQIVSDVHLTLGSPPDELLSLRELYSTTKNAIQKRMSKVSQSDQNQTLKSHTFTQPADTREIELTANIAKGVPAWVERRVSTDASPRRAIWEVVDVVNLHNLELWRNQGREACAFHGDADNAATVTLKTFIKFSYTSTAEHRLWYDDIESLTTLGIDDNTILPAAFNNLIKFDALPLAIAMMRVKAAEMETEENPISKAKFAAWDSLERQAEKERMEWGKIFKHWLYRSKSAQSAGNKTRKFKKNLYGGGFYK